MARRAGEEVRRGRQLIIFPEGTRTAVDAPPRLQDRRRPDLCRLRRACLPVALNSGLFWPRRTFMRYPGTLVVEFLDPLPPGLTRDEFIARVSDRDRGGHQPAGRGGAGRSRRSCSAACRVRRKAEVSAVAFAMERRQRQ